MGRKLNLGDLSGQECEKVFTDLQQESDIRQREEDRLSKIEGELIEAASKKSHLDREKELNEKNCVLCSSTFNFLFNKKLRCQECHSAVCRNCCVWDSKEKLWLCNFCERGRTLDAQSDEILSNHLNSKFKNYDGVKVLHSIFKRGNEWGEDTLQEDASLVTEVWTHVETLLEGLLGETLDNAAVITPHHHEEYNEVLMNYQEKLAVAVLNLAKALYFSLQRSCSDSTHADDLSPTTAHVHLKSVLLDLQNAISQLPLFEEAVELSAAGQVESSPIISANATRSAAFYEEILTSAVFNKLLELKQRAIKQDFDKSVRIDSEDKAMLNKKDSNSSTTSSTTNSGREYPDIVAHLDNLGNESDSTANTCQEKESSVGEESATEEFTWSKEEHSSLPPVEYVIEERVEEITTTEAYSDSDDDASNAGTSKYSTRQTATSSPDVDVKSCDIIPGLHYIDMPECTEILRVPFPELGLDVVNTSMLEEFEDGLSDLEDDASVRFMGVMSWEDNWLFKRKRIVPAFVNSVLRRTGFYDEPICMLIPNPNEFVYPLIGTREIDEISEMSERNSVGSLELESDTESEKEQSSMSQPVQLVKNVHDVHALDISSKECTLPKSSKPAPKLKSEVYPTKRPNVVPDPTRPQGLQVPKFVPAASRQNANRDPKFTALPENLMIHAGKVARFSCEVFGSKPIGVVWFKGNKQIENSEKYQISLIRQKYMLEVYETCKDDAGCYSCVVYNNKGQHWADFKMQVKPSSRAHNAPEFVVPLRVIQNNVDQVTRLSCTVSGYPEPKVHIYHDQQPLISGDQYVIEPTGYGEIIVEILSPKPKNEGQYYAIASNKLGDASSSCVLSPGGSNTQVNDANKNHHNNITTEETEKTLTRSKPKLIQRTWSQRQAELQRMISDAFSDKMFSSSPESTLMVRDEPDGSGSPNEDQITEAINWNPVALNVPPRPGTIAEREHNKWQNAVPWPNNPYSPENIARRKNKPGSEIILVDQPLTFEEFLKQSKEEEIDEKHQISLLASHAKSRDLARYKRDYYVNYVANNEKGGDKDKNKLQKAHVPEGESVVDEALNSLEEKVYVSASKAISPKEKVNWFEKEATSQITDSDREMSIVELEIARIRPATSNAPSSQRLSKSSRLLHSAKDSEMSRSLSEDDMSLPSVKELVSKFALQKSASEENGTNRIDKGAMNGKEVIVIENKSSENADRKPPQPLPRSSVKVATDLLTKPKDKVEMQEVDVELSCSLKEPSNNGIPVRQLTKQFSGDETYHDHHGVSVKRVHSLTARSLSREFRESAQRNLPRPMNRQLPVSQEVKEQSLTSTENSLTLSHESRDSSPSLPLSPFAGSAFTEGYTSDESTTSNNSLPRNKTRKRISRSVLQRATYWEKRAEQGLLSDTSVNEDFPPMESVPK